MLREIRYNGPLKNAYEERLERTLRLIKPITTQHKLIRLGNQDGDAGYLIPDDLEGITACFSPGVGFATQVDFSKQVDFDQDIMDRGITSYLADASVSEDSFSLSGDYHFTQKHIGHKDSNPLLDKLFGRYQRMRLDTWINSHKVEGDLLLQMDIEGSEYEVLDSVSAETLKRFRIMTIEFHRLGRLSPRDKDKWIDHVKYSSNYINYKRGDVIYRVFKKLSELFSVVHIHPCNVCPSYVWGKYEIPHLVEVTFLRKDRISQNTPAKTFPHPLDRATSNELPDIILPECWYK